MDFPKYAKIGISYCEYVPELKRYVTNGVAWPADESLVKSSNFQECSYHEWAKDQHPEWYDWKWISKQKGYLSIKKAYRDSLTYKFQLERRKKEALKAIKRIVSMASHYAYRLEKPIHLVLLQWEEKRTYNWISYYNNKHRINRIKSPTDSIKPIKKYYKNDPWYNRTSDDKKRGRALMLRNVHNIQVDKRKANGKKARWPTDRKLRAKKKY